MDVSKKTDYALRMLAALVRDPSGVVSVRAAARDNGVPYSFARSIQHDLVCAGMVESLRGARGGMRLSVDPEKITLLQVVEAIQRPVSLSPCATNGPDGSFCPRALSCCFNPIWAGAQELLNSYLSSVTLADVVAGTAQPVVEERFVHPGGSGRTPSLLLGQASGLTATRANLAAAVANADDEPLPEGCSLAEAVDVA